ncbi:hypothetical protein QBC35DRAFT_479358 [Podospora australis]|uniref:Uncharacterized protein n=1 Tax=Podospora australis TaxID=1536484 RepID=A0AAN6WHC4_9PEZI|nr:hypothetical protein QBC35DRAFT_479358 [Podospora australis]
MQPAAENILSHSAALGGTLSTSKAIFSSRGYSNRRSAQYLIGSTLGLVKQLIKRREDLPNATEPARLAPTANVSCHSRHGAGCFDPFSVLYFDPFLDFANLASSSQHLNQRNLDLPTLSTPVSVIGVYDEALCLTPLPPAHETHEPAETPPASTISRDITFQDHESSKLPTGQRVNSSDATDELPLVSGLEQPPGSATHTSISPSEQISCTSIGDCGSDVVGTACQEADQEESWNATLPPSLVKQDNEVIRNLGAANINPEPLEGELFSSREDLELAVTSSGAGSDSRKRRLDSGAGSPQSPKKRRCSKSKSTFQIIADILDAEGFIDKSFTLTVNSIQMYPDPDANLEVTFHWNRYQRIWLARGKMAESLPEDFTELARDGVEADYFLDRIQNTPMLFRILFRVSWGQELTVDWSDESRSFGGVDSVDGKEFKISKDHMILSLRSLTGSTKGCRSCGMTAPSGCG